MRSPHTRAWPTLKLFAGAAAATSILSIPVRRVLTSRGRLDVPNHRSSHNAPTPRGGGIAALLGTGITAVAAGSQPGARRTFGIGTLACVGWADDVTGHVSAKTRLASQLTVGGIAFSNGSWDAATSSVVTAGVVNVVNFMDGINGISGLTALTWGANAMHLAHSSDRHLAALGALTAGAGVGFLPHNAPTARLFLGDVGSYALGAAMAAGILSQRTLMARYRVAAPLLLYGVDAGQALVKRAVAGERLGEAHRDHIYQRLVDAGGSHFQVALWHAVGASMIGIASRFRLAISVPTTLSVAVGYLASPWILERHQAGSCKTEAGW